MDESILRAAGHKLYVTSRLKEMKRYLVFRARCRMHKDIIEDVLQPRSCEKKYWKEHLLLLNR